MLYTPIMSGISKRKNSSVTIILGLLLAAVGVGGLYYSNYLAKEFELKGEFRYLTKGGKPTITVLKTPVLTNQPIEVSPEISPSALNFYAFYVHYNDNPELEDPNIPEKIEIPNISLTAPVLVAEYNYTKVEGETFGQWVPPSEFAAAWHPDSAPLGRRGNTVINGHHNEFGKVFGKLVDLKEGDLVYVYSKGVRYTFIISNRMILPERFQEATVRLENAKWLGETNDVRLTLVTCWPADSNTHRLILVARPFLSVIPIPSN
jgi:LPXTG-site transpeptidase (sortase) family protein